MFGLLKYKYPTIEACRFIKVRHDSYFTYGAIMLTNIIKGTISHCLGILPIHSIPLSRYSVYLFIGSQRNY